MINLQPYRDIRSALEDFTDVINTNLEDFALKLGVERKVELHYFGAFGVQVFDKKPTWDQLSAIANRGFDITGKF